MTHIQRILFSIDIIMISWLAFGLYKNRQLNNVWVFVVAILLMANAMYVVL